MSAPSTEVIDRNIGFDKDIEDLLRSKKNGEKKSTWEDIWELLFGDTERIPDSGNAPDAGDQGDCSLLTATRI